MTGSQPPGGAGKRLAELGHALQAEGRFADAETIFGHLAPLHPDDLEIQRGLIAALGGQGRTLEALERMVAARRLQTDTAALLADIQAQSGPAIDKYNAHLAAGEVDQAERYAAALAALAPQSGPMLAAALACNLALNRADQVVRYAEALLRVEPGNPAAREALASLGQATAEDEIALRMVQALSGDLHPLIRLRDLHDVASLILCRPLTTVSEAQLEVLTAAALALTVEAEPGSEWEGWAIHYRLLMEAIDLAAVRAAAPEAPPEPEVMFATCDGRPTDWTDVRATADRTGARCVFFAAADEAYVDLYARWYALSVLKYADVPSLVVIHVIGGADRLAQIAAKVGVTDERLVFAGDRFDADAVTTQVFDSPPKGLIAKPVAHFQSVRFLRLGSLLAQLGQPIFVSDIDLLLQRGVEDLLVRAAGDDVMFNENELSLNAGSRLTANLMLVNPTPNAALFLRFLSHFLETALARPRVTRWIDQVALIFARHHLVRHADAPAIGYFDTDADINNVMYPSYQAHPFRFLSLFHGFDTSSLEGDPRVLGEGAA
jgi:tetratricopeptide (TPR) repeat protein